MKKKSQTRILVIVLVITLFSLVLVSTGPLDDIGNLLDGGKETHKEPQLISHYSETNDLYKTDSGFQMRIYSGRVNIKLNEKYIAFPDYLNYTQEKDGITWETIDGKKLKFEYFNKEEGKEKKVLDISKGTTTKLETNVQKNRGNIYYNITHDKINKEEEFGFYLNTTESLYYYETGFIWNNLQFDFSQAINEQNLTLKKDTINKSISFVGADLSYIDPFIGFYNYNTSSANISSFAKGCTNAGTSSPPSNTLYACTGTLSDLTYTSLASSENTRATTTQATTNDPYHLFYFNLNNTISNKSDITSLNFSWEGSTSSASGTVYGYWYNSSSSAWIGMFGLASSTTDTTIQNKTLNSIDFVNNSFYFHSLIYWDSAGSSGASLRTDYSFLEINYDGILINSPIDSQEILNSLTTVLNVTNSAYNQTIWWSKNGGIKNNTLCVSCTSTNWTTINFVRQGYYNLSVWGNKSDGSVTSKSVNNLFVGGNVPTLLINNVTNTQCGIISNYNVVVITNNTQVNICSYNGVGLNGTLQFNNVTYFILDSGSSINGNGEGYSGAIDSTGGGPGGGSASGSDYGGGGAYGGNGSTGYNSVAGGYSYGSSTNVTDMGSAGGGSISTAGGGGGGYLKINSTVLSLDGTISLSGNEGVAQGAGAGGGIWLLSSVIQGNINLNASGGSGLGTYSGGGGGGGRIFIQYITNSSSSSLTSVLGGKGHDNLGDNGTILWQQNSSLSFNSLNSPSVITNTLSNNSNFSVSNVNFTFNISDDNDYLTNISLFLDGTLNTTSYINQIITANENNSFSFYMASIPDGTHTWYIQAYDSDNAQSNSSTFTLNIDTGIPVVSFTSPTYPNNYKTTNTSNIANITIIEQNLTHFIWNWNSTNYTLYDNNLRLMFNFDNLTNLGENDTYTLDLTNNSAVIMGGLIVNGKYGKAIEVDGFNDFINVTYPAYIGNLQDLTISFMVNNSNWSSISNTFWLRGFKFGVTGSHAVYSKGAPEQLCFGIYINAAGTLQSTCLTNPSNYINGSVWNYVSFTHESSTDTDKIYIDGVERASGSEKTVDPQDPSLYYYIGGLLGTGPYLQGTIDEYRLWNRTLNINEVKQISSSNLNKHNSTFWGFYSSQTGLPFESSSYFACVRDIHLNENCTETRIVNITQNTLYYSPKNYSFAVHLLNTEQNNITVYMFDDSSEIYNYTINVSIVNATNFTINYPGSIILNESDNSTSQFSFVVNFQGVSGVPNGQYNGNITLNNTISGNTTLITFIYGINPPAGIPELYTTDNEKCTSEFTSNCSNSLVLQQSQSSNRNYTIKNVGSYNITGCQILFSGDLASQPWISNNIGSFNLTNTSVINVSITFSPAISTSVGLYSSYIYLYCNSGDAGGDAVESVTTNRALTNVFITAIPTLSIGGGGDKEPAKVSVIALKPPSNYDKPISNLSLAIIYARMSSFCKNNSLSKSLCTLSYELRKTLLNNIVESKLVLNDEELKMFIEQYNNNELFSFKIEEKTAILYNLVISSLFLKATSTIISPASLDIIPWLIISKNLFRYDIRSNRELISCDIAGELGWSCNVSGTSGEISYTLKPFPPEWGFKRIIATASYKDVEGNVVFQDISIRAIYLKHSVLGIPLYIFIPLVLILLGGGTYGIFKVVRKKRKNV